jgi:FSR family fosmidomycin resistance protein-like MFS transporter
MAQALEIRTERKREPDTRVIGLVSGAHFVSHFYILLLPPLFPFVRAEYGVNYTELGLALAAFNVVSAGLQTSAGFLTDRIGPPAVLIAGLLLGAGAFALAGLVPSFWFLVAMFAVAGLGNTVYHPADYSILSHHVAPQRMGQAYSIHSFAGMLGSAVAPPALLVLQDMVGWRGAFMAAALLGILAAVVMTLQRDALAGPIARARARAPEETSGAGWKLLFSPPLLRNLAFFVMLAISAGGIQNYSVVALGALYGTPLSIADTALGGYLLMISIGVLLGGLLASRTRRHDLVALTGLIAVALMTLTIGLASLGTAWLIALMAIGGLFSGLIMPSRDMIVRSFSPPGSFGKVFGFVTTGFNLGGIIAPLLFGWLMDQGHPRAIFLLGAACSLLSIPTVLSFGARRKPQESRA